MTARRDAGSASASPGALGALQSARRAVVVGAGLGGLATAARLAHAGYRVTLLERHAVPGGRAHIAGAVLLIGNVTVTGFWAIFLYRQRAAVPFRPVAWAILWTDLAFTLLGGLLPDQWRLERMDPSDQHALRRAFTRWTVVGWAATGVLFYGLWTMVTGRVP